MTPFIGREGELEKLEALIAGERLVTLVGPPGVGKTRLAREWAARSDVPVWFCELAEATDVDGVCRAVAAALGLASENVEDVAAVSGALARKRGVIVLDNFEQLASVATSLVEQWCAAAPGVRFIVTSRRKLGLASGEAALEIAPLAADDGRSSGVALFVALAKRVRSSFDESREGAELVELVRELDGVPLAIELAAARMAVMAPAALFQRLRTTRFDGALAGLERAIACSLALLDANEKRVLAECSVFHGGFTLEDAEAVIGAPSIEAFQSLEAQSLLTTTPSGQTLRLGTLLSVRDAAARELSTEARDAVRARHAERYRALRSLLVSAPSPATTYAPDAASMARVTAETENLFAAFDWFVTAGGLAGLRGALDCLTVLHVIGRARRPGSALGALYKRAIELASSVPGAARELCTLHLGRGVDCFRRGQTAKARADYVRAFEIARGVGDYELIAHCVTRLHVAMVAMGDHEEAHAELERAIREFPRGTHPALEAEMLVQLGTCAIDEGRLDEAEAALEAAPALDNPALDAQRIVGFGLIRHELGDFDEARRHYEAAISVVRELDARPLGYMTMYLAMLDHEMGDLDAARASYERAIALFTESDRRPLPLALAALAAIDAVQGRFDDAERRIAEAHQRTRDGEHPWISVMRVHESIVDWAAGGARRERALRRHAERSNEPRTMWTLRLAQRIFAQCFQGTGESVVIDPEGRAFRLPGQDITRVDKNRSSVLMLRMLVAHKSEAAHTPLSIEDLYAAGWPGEAFVASAANRVHVALSKLRQSGLRNVLVRRDGGYLLDPAVSITLARL